jgi:hypothetical protein
MLAGFQNPMPQEPPPRAAALSSEEPHTLPVDHTTVLFHPWIPATYQMPSAFLTGPAGDVFGIDLSEVHSRLDQTTTVYNPRQAPTDPRRTFGTELYLYSDVVLRLQQETIDPSGENLAPTNASAIPPESQPRVQSAAQTIAKPHSVSIPLGLIPSRTR